MKTEKVNRSIDIIKLAAKMSAQYYGKPLIVTYSGGKDSDVLADLAVKSGAEVEFQHSLTTVDAPETVHHVKEKFQELRSLGYRTEIHYPELSMWRLIEKKGMPPTRVARYCCDVLKENSTPNRYVATGVRSAESRARKGRTEFEVRGATKDKALHFDYAHAEEVYREAQEMPEAYDCRLIEMAKKNKNLICNPIISWTDDDVRGYIRENGIKYNPLYDRGYKRVGCVGCPMGGRKGRLREFADYPKYRDAYMRAFQRMLDRRIERGLMCKWKDAREVFGWWMEDPNVPGQMIIEDFEGGLK